MAATLTSTGDPLRRPVPRETRSCRLPADHKAAAALRRWVRAQLSGWRLEGQREDLLLIASELASNAVRHGLGSPRVTLALTRDATAGTVLRLGVTDAGNGFDPQQVARSWRHCDPADRCGGRGLLLVAELSSDWGAGPVPGGHEVWAHLSVA
ncbi:ATP-binding protein [Streptomyces sp. NA04227]|uniref:ATP-binding protein n=1 Tax=Streptomyces sp. NA04227 TaxID=2742136 RepID=UPI001590A8A5|nr:ATP-binding protein [Streptomyces sp. NA04227]QKW10297.1 ATP-binding protein [Streptomyces sp. NA04227]